MFNLYVGIFVRKGQNAQSIAQYITKLHKGSRTSFGRILFRVSKNRSGQSGFMEGQDSDIAILAKCIRPQIGAESYAASSSLRSLEGYRVIEYPVGHPHFL